MTLKVLSIGHHHIDETKIVDILIRAEVIDESAREDALDALITATMEGTMSAIVVATEPGDLSALPLFEPVTITRAEAPIAPGPLLRQYLPKGNVFDLDITTPGALDKLSEFAAEAKAHTDATGLLDFGKGDPA